MYLTIKSKRVYSEEFHKNNKSFNVLRHHVSSVLKGQCFDHHKFSLSVLYWDSSRNLKDLRSGNKKTQLPACIDITKDGKSTL